MSKHSSNVFGKRRKSLDLSGYRPESLLSDDEDPLSLLKKNYSQTNLEKELSLLNASTASYASSNSFIKS